MRKNATFISFLGIKPEENAVKAAKNGKKVAQKQGAINFVAECPQSNKALSKKSPRIGDINFSYFLYFIFQHITKKKGRNKFAPVVADKCINFKKRDNLQNNRKQLTSRLICDIILLKKYGGFKMRNLVTKEYRDLISKKLFLERERDKLPIGYISKKTIKGRVQFYLQRREGNKVTSIYIKFEDVDRFSEGIDKRKKFVEELSLLDDRLKQLEQAAILIDRDLYCQLLLYKLSYKMDDLETTERHVCSSFGSAMNAIEGVAISNETHNEIEKWKRGDKSFLTVFEDTLRRYGFPVEGR